jgi:hypothetical protein
MYSVALFARLEAKSGKEAAVAQSAPVESHGDCSRRLGANAD